ncbi:MAG: DUF6262 family protein [Cyanobacteria bacterium P01_D01_bin.56]
MKGQINRTWDEAERQKHGQQVKQRFAREREEKLSQAKAVIDELIEQGVTVSQNEIARRTGFSVGFVNKHLRGVIEQARQRQRQRTQKPRAARSVGTLEKENERLTASNRRLRQELDKHKSINRQLLAQVAQVVELEDEVALLRTQNRELLATWKSNQEKVIHLPTGTPRAEKRSLSESGFSDQIETELKTLGIKLTSTLRKTIEAASEQTVLCALEALKEASQSKNIKRPGGWLKSAIEGKWVQNESIRDTKETQYSEDFMNWYQKAVAAKFVLDIPAKHLSLDSHGEPKVKVNRPDVFGAPYTDMPWQEAREEKLKTTQG